MLKFTTPRNAIIESVPIATVLQAIKKIFLKTKLVQEAVEVAKRSKVVILVLGERAGLSLTDINGESRDRADIGLTEPQEELFQAIQEIGVPIVLVLINGRPLSMVSISEKGFRNNESMVSRIRRRYGYGRRIIQRL